MLNDLTELILDYVKIDPTEISESSSLRTDLGLDSLQMVNIIVELENKYGLTIQERDTSDLQTVGDLIEYVVREKGNNTIDG